MGIQTVVLMGAAVEPWGLRSRKQHCGQLRVCQRGSQGDGGSACVYHEACRRPPRLPVPPSSVVLGLGKDVSEAQVTSDTHTPGNWSQS